MKIFWNFSKRYVFRFKWWYLIGCLFIIGTQALTVGIIETTKFAIDTMQSPAATSYSIIPFAIQMVVLALLLLLVRTTSRYLVFTPGRNIECLIRDEYYKNLLYLQRDFFAGQETGDLVSRCSHDVTYVRVCYGFAILQVMNVSLTFFFGFGAMLSMDYKTTMWLALPMIISFAVIQASISMMFDHWRRSNKELGDISSFCLNAYKSISVIQGYHAEPVFLKGFADVNEKYLNTGLYITKVRSAVFPIVELVSGLSLFVVLWLVGPQVINKQLSLGQVTAFIGYIAMVMPPLLSLGWMFNTIQRAIPSMERLNEILCAQPNLLEIKEDLPPYQNQATLLEIKNLDFGYQESLSPEETQPFSLKNVHFSLPHQGILGIVGETGSGKTTLVEAILRLNLLPPRQVFLNGYDAAHTDILRYREYFSVVPQNAFLFSMSLRDNLKLALPVEQWQDPQLDDKLLEHLKMAGFLLDLKQLPEGLETMVGEKGIMLSGGQRQRVALARALLKNSAIYVLDDVLSAVDHETEHMIIQNLKKLQNKSFIIISHRVSAVKWADSVLVMEQGKIIDQGTHQELISRTGFYKEIFEYQQQGQYDE